MKILFISYKFYPDIGGIEVNSEIFATQFSNFGATIKVVTWTTLIGINNFKTMCYFFLKSIQLILK